MSSETQRLLMKIGSTKSSGARFFSANVEPINFWLPKTTLNPPNQNLLYQESFHALQKYKMLC